MGLYRICVLIHNLVHGYFEKIITILNFITIIIVAISIFALIFNVAMLLLLLLVVVVVVVFLKHPSKSQNTCHEASVLLAD
jgi:chromate transport protein ChrA